MKQYVTRKTAILVDGGYYRKRAEALWGRRTPQQRANELYTYCMMHISLPEDPRDLYRIFYYDCPPMKRKLIHPLDQSEINFADGIGTKWTEEFYEALSTKRKVALRMGALAENVAYYTFKREVVEDILSQKRDLSSLTKADFYLEVKQKGVDMRIGLDVASVAVGRYVDQIVLIAGDSDFLPVAKMARRNGVDFILDPMRQRPKRELLEHVDGIEIYTDQMYQQETP